MVPFLASCDRREGVEMRIDGAGEGNDVKSGDVRSTAETSVRYFVVRLRTLRTCAASSRVGSRMRAEVSAGF